MAIIKILIDDGMEKKMGLAGYKNVLRNYTWETITKKINNICSELI